MDPKSTLGGAVLGATIATVAALALKADTMTSADIKAAADDIRAKEAQVSALLSTATTWQTPEIAACLKDVRGTLTQCTPEVTELGSPTDAAYRVSYYTCQLIDGEAVATHYTSAEEEECIRAAVKLPSGDGEFVGDTRGKPELVRVATPKPPPVDPHPRDMSVPVYGKAGGAVAVQPKEIEKP